MALAAHSAALLYLMLSARIPARPVWTVNLGNCSQAVAAGPLQKSRAVVRF